MLPGGGSFTTLTPPPSTGLFAHGTVTTVRNASIANGDFSLVLESMQGNCLRCAGSPTAEQTVDFQLAGALLMSPPRILHVWQTTFEQQMQYLGNLTPAADGSFSINLPADAMVTVTTTVGQGKGAPQAPIPASAPFPLPYTDDYDSTRIDGLGRYHSDQGGSFEIAPACDGSAGHVLRQSVPVDAGPNAWVLDPLPITMVGPNSARDTVTSVNASLVWPQPGCGGTQSVEGVVAVADGTMVGVCGRVTARYTSGVCLLVGFGLASSGVVLNTTGPPDSGQCFVYLAMGTPMANTRTYQAAAPGVACPSGSSGAFSDSWHRLSLELKHASATGSVDGTALVQATLPDVAVVLGTSALTSGYHLAAFDELEIDGMALMQSRLVSTAVVHDDIRNDFTGEIGMRLSLNHTDPPATPIGVLGIGRFCASRANATHELRLYDATAYESSGGMIEPTVVANATLNALTACSDGTISATGFGYAEFPAATQLKPGAVFYVTSEEADGSDQFFGETTFPTVFVRPDLAIFDDQPVPVYRDETGWHVQAASTLGASYGPLDLLLTGTGTNH